MFSPKNKNGQTGRENLPTRSDALPRNNPGARPGSGNDSAKPRKMEFRSVGLIFVFAVFTLLTAVLLVYVSFQKNPGNEDKVSPEEILRSSFAATESLKTYNAKGDLDFNVSMELESMHGSKQEYSFNIETVARMDETDKKNPKSAFEANVAMAISSEGGNEKLSVDVEGVTVGEDLAYYKLTNYKLGFIGALYGPMISPYKGKWYRFDKKEIQSRGQGSSFGSFDGKGLENIEENYKLMSFKKDLGATKLGNASTYHYQLAIDKDEAVKLYLKLLDERKSDYVQSGIYSGKTYDEYTGRLESEIKKYDYIIERTLNNINIEVWIGKEDKFMHKMEIKGNFDEKFVEAIQNEMMLKGDMAEGGGTKKADKFDISFNLISELSNFNEPVQIEIPKDAEDFASLLPSRFPVDSNRVKSLWGAGRYEESLAAAQSLLKEASTDKERAVAYYWMGVSHYKLGDLNKAKDEELLAIELDPAYAAPYATLSAVSLSRNNCQEALGYAQRSESLDPSFAWAHNDLGLSYLCLGDREKGINELKKAVELAPDTYVFQDNYNRALQQK